MSTNYCPQCDTPIPEQAQFCDACQHTLSISSADDGDANTIIGSELTAPLLSDSENSDATQRLMDIPLSSQATLQYVPESFNAGEDIDESRRGTNWHKDLGVRVLDHPAVTPRPFPAVRPSSPNLPPTEYVPLSEQPKRRYTPPSLFFWITTVILLIVFLGGLTGIAITLGRNSAQTPSTMSLQVTPSIAAFGTTVTLRGTFFTPGTHIGLTRDNNIPIADTASLSIISADQHGTFSDTVIIASTWQAGSHIIHAEDAKLHKIASFTITVTGKSTSLPTPHLQLSVTSLDLGSADQATNSIKTITLMNTGGGQISWQGSATVPWLLLSPKNGTLSSSSAQVAIAADRSQMKPGSYTAKITFLSSAGEVVLPVKIQTTSIQSAQGPVLELTPAALSFTGADGGTNPPSQTVTINNPGIQTLQWSTSVINGNGWLSVSPSSGQVAKGSSQNVTITVNTATSLPGTYNGTVTFTGQGQVKDSPQYVVVSLTVQPQCSLQASPGSLTFSSIAQQAGPADQKVNLNVSQSCSAQLSWTASASTINGGSWLSLSSSGGTTPSSPSIHINTTGLNPGTYTGSILFSTKNGSLTLPVSFTLAQPTTPILSTTPGTMGFSTIIGQSAPPTQTITIANNGGGTLTWQAAPATSSGGSWLAVSSSSSTLSGGQSTTISVSSTVLSGMTPGTYNGTVTMTGTDSSGHTAAGSPQILSISFLVQAPCTIAATPNSLAFTGIAGQANPAAQTATITASGTCVHNLNWAATTSGETWLSATPSSGSVSLSAASSTQIGISLSGLAANTYQGTVTISATDSVTGQQIGTPQSIAITLTVQPPCTLQTPSPASLSFTGEAGTNPATQNFTIGVTGACTGTVTVTPTVTGSNWLSVSPSSATISGSGATFTATVSTSSLSAGSYTNTISLAATDGSGTIASSPQTVSVSLTVTAPPALSASPGTLTFNVTSGTSSQAITINNTGGAPLNWAAALGANSSYASLSASSGTNVAGGSSATLNVTVNAAGLTGGTTYTTTVTLTATDPATGNAVSGSPATINITVNVAAASMSVSTTTLSFSTPAGTNPASQPVTLTNTGGGTLTWTAGTPSQSWLTIDAASGNDISGGKSTINFSVNVTGLAAGSFSATEVITPSVGNAVTITVNLTVT